MKTSKAAKKLVLGRATLRQLTKVELKSAVGGARKAGGDGQRRLDVSMRSGEQCMTAQVD